jgi:hypothetical protein
MAKKKAPPAKKTAPQKPMAKGKPMKKVAKGKPKSKLPTLGGGLMGLGGTGASGMIP